MRTCRELAGAFQPLEFVRTLPFEETARMIMMSDDEGRSVTAHRDHELFSAEFRSLIATPSCNLASTAALWACVGSGDD